MLTIRLLGPTEVLRDGAAISLTPRATGVLVRLAMAREPVSRDQLLMDLWGEDVPRSRRRSLETLVSALRAKATGRLGLTFQDGCYALAVPVDLDLELVLDAARSIAEGRPTDRSVARANLAAQRGEPTLSRLGSSLWIDALDQEMRAGIEVVRVGARVAPALDVHYAMLGKRHLAYQVRDGTEPTVLLNGGLATHCAGIWEAPGFAEWVDSSFGGHRLVMFDKRGCGLSDPVTTTPTDREFVDDTIAVLDEAGVDRVVLVCAAEAGMWGAHLAATHPERVDGAVFINATPKMFEAEDYPCGLPELVAREFGESVRKNWARSADARPGSGLELSAPSRARDPAFRQWAQHYEQITASPGSIWHLAKYTGEADSRAHVRRMEQPAIVLQSRRSKYFRPSTATWLAEALDIAGPVWLDSSDHLFWIADPAQASRTIADFLDALSESQPALSESQPVLSESQPVLGGR